MIQLRSLLNIADNTGAHIASVIQIYGGSKRKYGTLGDRVNAVVKKADPTGMVKQHELIKAVIVRVRKEKKKSGRFMYPF